MAKKKEFKTEVSIGGKTDNSLGKAFNTLSKKIANVKKSSGALSKAFSGLKTIGVGVAKTVGAGVAAAGAAMVAGGIKAVGLASDLTEVQNVVDTVFGQNASTIDAWAKNAATQFGLAELSAKQFAGQLGAAFTSIGFDDSQITEMSTALTGLAGDMASFYNVDAEEAFTALRAGIVSGEAEPLKKYGVLLNQASLESYRLSKGIKMAYKDMSEAEKVQLRYGMVMEATAKAQGDFNKTSQDSLANQKRILELNFNNSLAELGKQILPIVLNVVKQLNALLTSGVVEKFFAPLTSVMDTIGTPITELLSYIADGVLPELSGAFTTLVTDVILPVIPILVDAIKATLPALSDVIGILADLFVAATPVLEKLMPTFEQLMPVIVDILQMFSDVIVGLLPVVEALLPIINKLLPVISMLAEFLGKTVCRAIEALMPAIETLCEMIGALLTPIIDALSPILDLITMLIEGQAVTINNLLMPILDALWPLLEVVADLISTIGVFISALTPILEPIIGLFEMLASIIGDVLGPVLEIILVPIQAVTEALRTLFGWIGDALKGLGELLGISSSSSDTISDIGANVASTASNQYTRSSSLSSGVRGYAEGGIATTPSIFGEDGPEMAIPLERTQRSFSLLKKTQDILGVGGSSGQTINVTYAPVINGASQAEIERALDNDRPKFLAGLKAAMAEEARLSYA